MTGLPPTLERFGAELENVVRRDLGKRRRRHRMIRATAVLAIVAAGALGLLGALSTNGGPSAVARAAAALQPSDDTILHYRLDAEQTNGDGTSVSWHSETWQLLGAPYTRRQVEVGSDGIRAESVSEGDTNELYDASTNTIYIATSAELRAARMPTIEIVSRSKLAKLTGDPNAAGAYLVRSGSAGPHVIATEAGAERFRKQLEAQHPSGEVSEDFRSDILAVLESGKARVTGHVDVDGRDAVRIESVDGKQVYLVDASTYDPVEWTTTGNDGGVTLRFPIYEKLPADSASMDLLSLRAQHPDAQVVHGAAAYMAAEQRLYPHG